MTRQTARSAALPAPRWLTPSELESWLSVVRLLTWLPWSIDRQLQGDSKLGMVEYQVLAMLSDRRERTMRMSSLAEVTNASLSRLSHLVKRLEGRGLVRREPDPTDGRFTNAILTENGFRVSPKRRPAMWRTSGHSSSMSYHPNSCDALAVTQPGSRTHGSTRVGTR